MASKKSVFTIFALEYWLTHPILAGSSPVVLIEISISQARPAQIAEIADIVGDHTAVEARDFIPDHIAAPGDLLAYALLQHPFQRLDVDGVNQLRLFFLQLQQNAAEQPQVGVFVPVDIADLLCGARAFYRCGTDCKRT